MSTQTQLLWHDPVWQKEAHAWIRSEAERNSIQLIGEIEQNHAYAWSTVMRVPTNEGTTFFKATAAETAYESALTKMLAGWYPDCMPEFIAIDTTRGWMLMRDGGEQLRASIRPTQDIAPWDLSLRVMQNYRSGSPNTFPRCSLWAFQTVALPHCPRFICNSSRTKQVC